VRGSCCCCAVGARGTTDRWQPRRDCRARRRRQPRRRCRAGGVVGAAISVARSGTRAAARWAVRLRAAAGRGDARGAGSGLGRGRRDVSPRPTCPGRRISLVRTLPRVARVVNGPVARARLAELKLVPGRTEECAARGRPDRVQQQRRRRRGAAGSQGGGHKAGR
jgi:hypothetical protein